MKEIISIVVIIASILGGTVALIEFHDTVRRAALEKAAQGLPSLERMSRVLQRPRRLVKRSDFRDNPSGKRHFGPAPSGQK
jgi:hypothetical protein